MKTNVYCVATKLSQLNEYIMRRQNRRLKAAIEESGLGGLLNLSMPTINLELMHYLVNAWDSRSGLFRFSNGESMTLTEDDIQRVYCLPRGDEFIDVKRTRTDLLKDAAQALIDRLGLEPMTRKFTISEEHAEAKMKNYAGPPTDLVPLYVLLAIHMLLDPPSCKKNVSMKYAYFVRDVAMIKACNWPGFVRRILREGLNAYNFDAQYARLAGDAHCLMVRYMDRFVETELQPPTASRWGRFNIPRADLLKPIGIVKERRKRRGSVKAAEENAEEEDDAIVSEVESYSDDELLSNFIMQSTIPGSGIDAGSSFRMNELGTTSSLLENESTAEEMLSLEEQNRKSEEEERLRKEAEEQKRKEDDEERLRKKAEDERLRKEADEERLRKEADDEERIRKEAEDERLRKEADEERLRNEADDEERLRKEADEEMLRKEAEDKKSKEDEDERIRKDAEDKKLKEDEDERLRRKAEEQKRKEDEEERLRKEAEDKKLKEDA